MLWGLSMSYVSTILFFGFFLGGTVVLSLGTYFVMSWFAGAHADDETEKLAGSVIFRIGALHGLILALVFAQQIVSQNTVREAINKEASVIEDVFFDLGRYDAAETFETRKILARYVHTVIHHEWEVLASEDRLSKTARHRLEAVYQGILDLEPTTRRQEILQTTMVRKIQTIASLRQARAATSEVGPDEMLFWVAALIGVVLVSASFFTFRPTRLNIYLLVAFAIYTGLILGLIAAISDDYNPPAELKPIAFMNLLTGELENFYDGK
jgi:hypothetical protein